MLHRGGLHHVAFVGFLAVVAGLLVVPSFWSGEQFAALRNADEPRGAHANADGAGPHRQSMIEPWGTVPGEREIAPGDYEAWCQRPQEPEQADLCQQWRMAQAAEEQVTWVRSQYYATWYEIGALVITVFFTAWAAVAASTAARAAQKSADIIPNIERAYVFFWDTQRVVFRMNLPTGTRGLGTPDHTVIFKNCGKTPAIIVRLLLGCDVFAQSPIPQGAPEAELPSGAVIGADDEWPRGRIQINREMLDRAEAQNARIYLYGEIVYRDIFRREWRSWFCRQWANEQFVLADLTAGNLNGQT